MNIEQTITLRTKMLGAMLRDARTKAGKSIHETANWLEISPSTLTSFEMGRKAISLPELELLSCYFRVPIEPFLHLDAVRTDPAAAIKTRMWVTLRQRIIGIFLKQSREELGRSLKEISEETGFPAARVSAYERGMRPIPIPELEALLTVLGQPIEKLNSTDGHVGRGLLEQRLLMQISDFPLDVLRFLTEEDSLTYLDLALRLKSISAEKLRGLTEGLKEITP